MHSELDVLSERYSQKCLELSRTEQSSKGREMELGRKERELEQLKRENEVCLISVKKTFTSNSVFVLKGSNYNKRQHY